MLNVICQLDTEVNVVAKKIGTSIYVYITSVEDAPLFKEALLKVTATPSCNFQ